MYPYIRERVVLVDGPGATGVYNLNEGRFDRVTLDAGQMMRSLDGLAPFESFDSDARNFIEECCKKGLIEMQERPIPRLPTPLSSVLRKIRPVRFAWIELTSRCNQLCKHCFVGDELNQFGHVGKEKVLEYFETLATTGCRQVVLSGGEPTLHPHIAELLDATAAYPFRVSLLTNASTPSSTDLTESFIRNSVTLKIPLLGWESTHDAMAGAHGCFQKTVKAIRELNRKGVRIELGTTVTSLNKHDVEKIASFAQEMGLPLEVSPIYAIGWAVKNKSELMADDLSEIVELCKRSGVPREQKISAPLNGSLTRGKFAYDPTDYDAVNLRDYLTAHAECGQKVIAVLSSGAVTPCLMLRDKEHHLGSTRSNSLAEILSETFAGRAGFDDRMQLSKIVECASCEARFVCKAGGCPASAKALTGEVARRNPLFDQCYYKAPSQSAASAS